MESFFCQLSGFTFFFVNNTQQKAVNLLFHLILHVAKEPGLLLLLKCNLHNFQKRDCPCILADLKGALAVHFNFPLRSFSLYLTSKSGIAPSGEPIPSE